MIYLHRNKIELISSDSQEEAKNLDSLLPYLNEEVELGDGFTLGDLFKILEKDHEIFSLVFGCQLGHHSLMPFIEDSKRDIKKEPSTLESLDLCWVMKLDEFEGDTDIGIYTDFSGWGPTDDEYCLSHGITHTSYAVEFSPLSELKELPIKLITETKVYKRVIGKTFREEFFVGEKPFTVYDFIGGILHEISFCGYPEERDIQLGSIKEAMSEAKEVIKNGEEFKGKKFDSPEDFFNYLEE